MLWVPLILIVVVLYALFRSWSVTFIVIFAFTVWLLFFKETWCDVETSKGTGCRRPVKGKLKACRYHKREKRDALWALFRLINPGRLIRIMWSRTPGQPANITPTPVDLTPRILNPAYDAAILIAAVVSAAGTLITVFVQVAAS
jgi:hypothetical protein